jgi:hypothetical protein
VIGGCGGDDSSGPDGNDPVIVGLAIREAGVTLVSVDGSQVVGSVDIPENGSSPVLTMIFVGENGGQIQAIATETMNVTVADPSIAEFDPQTAFSGAFDAVALGETTFVVQFLRDGAVVYTSPPIRVSVFGPSE